MATKMTRRALMVGVVVATLVAAAGAQQLNPTIVARDQLEVTVWQVQEWSRTYQVAPDGTIDFPELGRVPVEGLTSREVEIDLAKRLKDAQLLLSPQVTIELVQTATKSVTVSGSVVAPGSFQYVGQWRVFDALIRAGQATSAAGEEILLLRASARGPDRDDQPLEQTQVTVSLVDLQKGDLSNNPVLEDGDFLIIPRAEQVFITGYVSAPGGYTVRTGMTVEQALALAGGISERGSSGRIEITRMVEGERTLIKGVKLEDSVKPGDTIKVNRSIM